MYIYCLCMYHRPSTEHTRTMGSSNSGGKSKKCQQCRTRKIKCDLKAPQCSQCLGAGKTCSGPVQGNIFIAMSGQGNRERNSWRNQGQSVQTLSSTGSSSVQQPDLQLVPAVASGSLDPFSTYPVLPYPSEGVDRLVSFYLSVIGPKIISVNPKGTWFPSALADPLLFQSTLYSSALHFNSLWRAGDNRFVVFHRAQLLSMVKSRLQDPRQALSDQTIAAVALIVYTEAVNGPISCYSTHMNGLNHMMNMRGNLGASCLVSLLQRMIASSKIFAAIRLNCTEPAPLLTPDPLGSTPSCISVAIEKPVHLSSTVPSSVILGKLKQYGFHPDVLMVFNDLYQIVSLFHHESCQRAAELHQADLDAQLLYAEYRLVKCQSVEKSGIIQVQRSFCVACLIFISLFLREMPGPVLLNEALTKRFRETMGSIDQKQWTESPPEVLLWMFFMGGMIASGRPERPWFVSCLSELGTALDFQDWDSMKLVLRSVLWVHKIPEVSCKALCGEVVNIKT